MIHAFSLIHDDLPAIDNDDLRRGMPTCHKKFGEAVAILAGDALFALSFEVVGGLEAPSEQRVQVLNCLAKATGSSGLVGGEMQDILSEGTEPSAEIVQFIHERKTASLIAASCQIGAIVAGGNEHERAGAHSFGMALGLAFQIADDVLNEVSDAKTLGKAVGSDRDRKKATYPAVYGLDRAKALMHEKVEEAKTLLASLPANEFLSGLADYAIERTY
jgi:geranylgeranyl diphosphate synthase type II